MGKCNCKKHDDPIEVHVFPTDDDSKRTILHAGDTEFYNHGGMKDITTGKRPKPEEEPDGTNDQ